MKQEDETLSGVILTPPIVLVVVVALDCSVTDKARTMTTTRTRTRTTMKKDDETKPGSPSWSAFSPRRSSEGIYT